MQDTLGTCMAMSQQAGAAHILATNQLLRSKVCLCLPIINQHLDRGPFTSFSKNNRAPECLYASTQLAFMLCSSSCLCCVLGMPLQAVAARNGGMAVPIPHNRCKGCKDCEWYAPLLGANSQP